MINSKSLTDNILRSLPRLVVLLFCLLVLLIYIPFGVEMPSSGLDPSWQLAMSLAAERGLVFGQDLIFTFGPYSSVYTRLYTPLTDTPMLLSSAFLALAFMGASLIWLRGKYWYLLLLAIALVFFTSRDALLFVHCFVTMLAVFAYCYPSQVGVARGYARSPILILMFASLGLLPLIKVSMLPLCGLTIIVLGVILLSRRLWLWSVAASLIPVIAMMAFWLGSGQPLSALLSFLHHSLPIISAYAESMQIWGGWEMPIFFVLISLALTAAVGFSGERPIHERLLFLLPITVFLFISFKAGFVRADSTERELTALAGLSLASVAVFWLIKQRYLWLFIVTVFLVSLSTLSRHFEESWQVGLAWQLAVNKPLDEAIKRIQGKSNHARDFRLSMARLRQQYPLPKLEGSVDIYSFDQAYLLASNNIWAPRPAFQSYSAYAPELIEANVRHLSSAKSPDNILFRMQPIGGKYPSLEDGASWPDLLNRYVAKSYDSEFLFLRRRVEPFETARRILLERDVALGEELAIPGREPIVFASIDLHMTVLGRLLSAVFKPTPLYMQVTLNNGEVKRYQLVSGMASSSFLLSPLIRDTREFIRFAGGEDWALSNNLIKSVRVEAELPWLPFWRAKYHVKLEELSLQRDADAKALLVDQYSAKLQQGSVLERINCSGGYDEFEIKSDAKNAKLLSGSGWLTVDTNQGVAPEQIFLQIMSSDGSAQAFKARQFPRNDVNLYFKNPNMGNIGYSVEVDLEPFSGDVLIALGVRHNGHLSLCGNTSRTLTLR